MRIGHGYDVHKLAEGRKCIIGGVDIPFEKGLLGHSDADVLTHAVMDALLGAAALGDIGLHFPDTDEKYKDADSLKLLEEVGDIIEKKLYVVENIDATIRFLKKIDWNGNLCLLPYHDVGKDKHKRRWTTYNPTNIPMETPSDETMLRCVRKFESEGFHTTIGG